MFKVISPNASEEELETLTNILTNAEKGEKSDIEFKTDLFIDTTAQKAELAKDVALQASLPEGGNILYGIDKLGKIVGVTFCGKEESISTILANRLQFVSSGIEIIFAAVDIEGENPVPLIWIRVPKSNFDTPCAFLDKDGIWKMPIRTGTTTKYLNPVEAVQYYKCNSKMGVPLEQTPDIILETGADYFREVIESNLLELKTPPRTVTVVKMGNLTLGDIENKYGMFPFPFAQYEGELISLRETRAVEKYFGNGGPRPYSKNARDYLREKDKRRVIVNLLNQELFTYADNLGFNIDVERGRIFFSLDGGQIRKITWSSFSKKATRTVVGFTADRDGNPRYWYHYGAYLNIKEIERSFFIAVSPTWVFTFDGEKPLDKEIKQKVATKKMNREDNARILYNQHFWFQFFSGNNKSFRLPLAHNCGLVTADPLVCNINVGLKNDNIRLAERVFDEEDEIPEPVLIGDGGEEDRDV